MSFKNPNCIPFTLWRASDVMELLLKSQPIAEPGNRCRCSSTRVARTSIHPLRGNDVSILTPSSFFWPIAERQTSIQVVAPLHVSKFSASLPHLPYFLLADGIGNKNTPCPHFWIVMYLGLCPANIWGFCHSSSLGKLLTRNPPATFTISRALLYLSQTTPLIELALKHSLYPFFATWNKERLTLRKLPSVFELVSANKPVSLMFVWPCIIDTII